MTIVQKLGTFKIVFLIPGSAGIFNIKILVLSSIGPDVTMVISPTTSILMARIQLDQFVEGVGEHYLCVEGYNSRTRRTL